VDDDTKTCPRCAEAVRTQAKVCRYCGYDFSTPEAAAPGKKKSGFFKVAGWGCLGLIVLIVVLAAIGSNAPRTNSPTAAEEPSSTASQTSGSFSLKKITAEEYAQLHDGMSYSEAASIIGDPGEEVSRSNVAGYVTVAYSWKNYDGSNANVIFQNDRLVSKAEFGL
jgi:hypothetical protein